MINNLILKVFFLCGFILFSGNLIYAIYKKRIFVNLYGEGILLNVSSCSIKYNDQPIKFSIIFIINLVLVLFCFMSLFFFFN